MCVCAWVWVPVCVHMCECAVLVLVGCGVYALVLECSSWHGTARLTASLPYHIITYHGDVAIAEQQMSRNAIDVAALVQRLKLHVAIVIYR